VGWGTGAGFGAGGGAAGLTILAQENFALGSTIRDCLEGVEVGGGGLFAAVPLTGVGWISATVGFASVFHAEG
jgi:hypothetical protein